jgi:putative membrane protein
MGEERVRSVVYVLLFSYVVGRILQLFVGEVPSLFIVSLHVIPPALFAVVHGARIYRLRGITVFAILCVATGAFFEILSLRTGFPFGHYRFTDLMGPAFFGLPIMLALAYLGMGYLSWVVGLAILQLHNQELSGRNRFLLPVVASFVMTAWDLSMDPVWAAIDHAWVWRDGGPYYGVPISNFFGWLLTTYIFYQLFALYLGNRGMVRSSTNYLHLGIVFYAVSAAGNLFVIAPPPLDKVFLDASGTRWTISSILWASRLFSVFVMLPLSLFAWMRASRQINPINPIG